MNARTLSATLDSVITVTELSTAVGRRLADSGLVVSPNIQLQCCEFAVTGIGRINRTVPNGMTLFRGQSVEIKSYGSIWDQFLVLARLNPENNRMDKEAQLFCLFVVPELPGLDRKQATQLVIICWEEAIRLGQPQGYTKT